MYDCNDLEFKWNLRRCLKHHIFVSNPPAETWVERFNKENIKARQDALVQSMLQVELADAYKPTSSTSQSVPPSSSLLLDEVVAEPAAKKRCCGDRHSSSASPIFMVLGMRHLLLTFRQYLLPFELSFMLRSCKSLHQHHPKTLPINAKAVLMRYQLERALVLRARRLLPVQNCDKVLAHRHRSFKAAAERSLEKLMTRMPLFTATLTHTPHIGATIKLKCGFTLSIKLTSYVQQWTEVVALKCARSVYCMAAAGSIFLLDGLVRYKFTNYYFKVMKTFIVIIKGLMCNFRRWQ
jgi:hypothetical protein